MADLGWIATETLETRYLLRDKEGNLAETPDELWWRVAKAIASVEKTDQLKEKWAKRFYERMKNQDFMPNTPTLINAGKEEGQLSACFVLPIEDSMDGIFTSLKDAAIIHKTGGGTGFDFSRLRPEGSLVSNKMGVSTGPLAFCQVYDKATDVVKQGATRRGANMMNLRVDHPDILDFIDMKMEPGVMTNFNVSVTVTDEFMQALENDEEYELKHPTTGVTGKLRAKVVWEKIAHNAWKSAEPGIIFIDRVNQYSPYHENIEATNPCGEQPLPPYGSCNLGSINYGNFVDENGKIMWGDLSDCIKDCVRFLDNVIDANCYPGVEDDRIRKHALKYRNIGLGPMGWADMLIKLGVPYNSEMAVDLAKQIQRYTNGTAHNYSIELAEEKSVPEGAPFAYTPSYSSATRRNATLTTAAPTGSISIIAECSAGIEPVFAFVMERHQLDKVMVDHHPLYKQHVDQGKYAHEAFVPSHEVEVDYHVRMQAAFQQDCDSAISKTINLPKTAAVQDVLDAYQKAWETGCKGITVYVDGSRGVGVLSVVEDDTQDQEEYCCESPQIVLESGCEVCKSCGTSKCLIA